MNIEEIDFKFAEVTEVVNMEVFDAELYGFLQDDVFKGFNFNAVEKIETSIEKFRNDVLWYWLNREDDERLLFNIQTKNGIEYSLYIEDLPDAGEPYMLLHSYKGVELPTDTDWVIQSEYDFEEVLGTMVLIGLLDDSDVPSYLTDEDIDYSDVEYVDTLAFKQRISLTNEQIDYLKKNDVQLLEKIKNTADSYETELSCAVLSIKTLMEELEGHFPSLKKFI